MLITRAFFSEMRAAACKFTVAAFVALLLIAPAAVAAPAGFWTLSNERWYTRSAYVDVSTWVYAKPSADSKRLDRLRARTFHGSLAVVVVLGQVERDGVDWSYVRYPGLGDRRGWVLTQVLSATTLHRSRLVINRAALRIRLWRRGKLVFEARIGAGAPDSPTPAGRYYVRERITPVPGSIYGVLAFGTSAYSPYRTDWPGGGQVGIHGTNEPGLIPGHVSNGCIRLRNPDVARLGRLLRVGTPILIV
jgi:lipoprotein-anchoring transpeptidase ErfK/SrfK